MRKLLSRKHKARIIKKTIESVPSEVMLAVLKLVYPWATISRTGLARRTITEAMDYEAKLLLVQDITPSLEAIRERLNPENEGWLKEERKTFEALTRRDEELEEERRASSEWRKKWFKNYMKNRESIMAGNIAKAIEKNDM